MLMVTSPCKHSTVVRGMMLHTRGLVPNLLGLRRQFRGDWSQRMAGFTSESDSNTIIAGEEKRGLSYYFFSVTTDINRASKNPQVPEAQSEYYPGSTYGVCVHFFCFWLSVNPLWSSATATGYSGGRQPTANVGVHSYIGTKASSISVSSSTN